MYEDLNNILNGEEKRPEGSKVDQSPFANLMESRQPSNT